MYTGNAISRKQLEPFKTDRDATRYLRSKTCFLKNRARKPDHRFFSFAFRKSENRIVEPVIAPVSLTLLSSDIAGLPAENRLVSQKYMTAYYARAFQIPNILKEIGRLREITFRSAQEGTGRSSDIDRFDQSYVHLFLWNEKKSEIVGAYRMGLTDELLARQGKRGLYSHTLFRYKPEFLQRIGSSIEMGRSFIRLEYQRKYSSLLLLWQGIGQFILKHPKYSLLFGPVSISRNYHVISKSLMVQFLTQNRFDPKLSGFVSPRKPYRVEKIKGVNPSFIKTQLKNYNDVSVMVSEIEKDGKGLPVLLQHYLKLNARLVGFNVDNNFSDVVDGLILVDLKQTEPRLIRRFMGDEGVRLFEMDKTA